MHYGASLQGKMSNDGEKIALKLRLKHNPSADLILWMLALTIEANPLYLTAWH